jgi:hypothetical protein
MSVGVVAGRHGYNVQMRRSGGVGLRCVVQWFIIRSVYRSPLPQSRGPGEYAFDYSLHAVSGWCLGGSPPRLEVASRQLRGSAESWKSSRPPRVSFNVLADQP